MTRELSRTNPFSFTSRLSAPRFLQIPSLGSFDTIGNPNSRFCQATALIAERPTSTPTVSIIHSSFAFTLFVNLVTAWIHHVTKPSDNLAPFGAKVATLFVRISGIYRSEERRVGKECRSRWS